MRRLVACVSFVAVAMATVFTVHARQETAAAYQGPAAENFLTKAKIVSTRPLGSGITRPLQVTLELDGVTRLAVFKSIDERKAAVGKIARQYGWRLSKSEIDHRLDPSIVQSAGFACIQSVP